VIEALQSLIGFELIPRARFDIPANPVDVKQPLYNGKALGIHADLNADHPNLDACRKPPGTTRAAKARAPEKAYSKGFAETTPRVNSFN